MAESQQAQRRRRRAQRGALALTLLLASVAACAGDRVHPLDSEAPPVRPVVPFLLRYAGTTTVDGEIDGALRSGARRGPFPIELRAVAAGSSELLLEQRVWFEGREAAPVLETTLVVGERVFIRRGVDGPFTLLAGGAAGAARDFAELVWRAPAPIAGGAGDSDVERQHWRANPRLGDVLETAHYRHVSAEQGRPVAHELDFERFGATSSQKADVKLEEAGRSAALAGELAAPAQFHGVDSAAPRVKLVAIAPGVFAAEESESDVRSLVVVFERELVVVEAPLASDAGERIVAALADAWPKRPIGHVLFSDARPRFSGGLRAFLAAGATIVTTPPLAPSVEATVTRPFTLEPDRLARRGGTLKIETFSEGRRFADATNELQVLRLGDVGPQSDAVVFWLPRAHLLFGGDLGFTRAPDGALHAAPDGAALRELVRARPLAVERLLPSFPVSAAAGPIPFAEWARLFDPAAPAASTSGR